MNKIEPHSLTRLVWARAILKGSRLMLTLRVTETLEILPMKPVTVTQHSQPQVTKTQRCLLFIRYFLHAGCRSERDPVGRSSTSLWRWLCRYFHWKDWKAKAQRWCNLYHRWFNCPQLSTFCDVLLFYFWNLILDRVSTRSPGWPEVLYVNQASLEFIEMDLPLLPKQ